MKTKILVEGQFGNGGRRGILPTVRRKLARVTRSKVGKAGIPFDWATGIRRSHQLSIPIKNQGQSSSCGGQAKGYWLGIVQALLSNTSYAEQSAKSIYSRVAYPGGGTTVSALEKDLGALEEVDLSSQPPTEANLTDKAWLNTANLTKAMAKAGWVAQSVNLDMESIAEAIRDYGTVIFELTGQNNGTWLSANPKPPIIKNIAPLWNHFVCGEGASTWNSVKTFSILQSWGNGIGENGIQYFMQDYLDSGYILDCFTFVKKNPPFLFNHDLSYGMQNLDVVQLQQRLGSWQTGYYGFITWCAVNLYQYLHGIPRTGICDEATRTSLNLFTN